MRFPIITRAAHEKALAAALAETRQVEEGWADDIKKHTTEADKATARHVLQLAEAEAANKRLADRVKVLTERLALARAAQGDEAIEMLHDRLDRALHNVVRWRAEAADAHRVTAFLGEQLLSAVGAEYTPVQRAAVGLPVVEGEEVKTP